MINRGVVARTRPDVEDAVWFCGEARQAPYQSGNLARSRLVNCSNSAASPERQKLHDGRPNGAKKVAGKCRNLQIPSQCYVLFVPHVEKKNTP